MGAHLALETPFYLHPFLTMNIIPAQTGRLAIFQRDQSLRLGTMAYSGLGGGLGPNHTQVWGLQREGTPHPQRPRPYIGRGILSRILKSFAIFVCPASYSKDLGAATTATPDGWWDAA